MWIEVYVKTSVEQWEVQMTEMLITVSACGYTWSTRYLPSFRFVLLLSFRLCYLPLPQPSSPAASPVNLPAAKLLLLDQLLRCVCFRHRGESAKETLSSFLCFWLTNKKKTHLQSSSATNPVKSNCCTKFVTWQAPVASNIKLFVASPCVRMLCVQRASWVCARLHRESTCSELRTHPVCLLQPATRRWAFWGQMPSYKAGPGFFFWETHKVQAASKHRVKEHHCILLKDNTKVSFAFLCFTHRVKHKQD